MDFTSFAAIELAAAATAERERAWERRRLATEWRRLQREAAEAPAPARLLVRTASPSNAESKRAA